MSTPIFSYHRKIEPILGRTHDLDIDLERIGPDRVWVHVRDTKDSDDFAGGSMSREAAIAMANAILWAMRDRFVEDKRPNTPTKVNESE